MGWGPGQTLGPSMTSTAVEARGIPARAEPTRVQDAAGSPFDCFPVLTAQAGAGCLVSKPGRSSERYGFGAGDRYGVREAADPKRSARRIAKYGLQGWIGIQDSPEDIARWKGEIGRELNELGHDFPDGFDMCSMIWFVITDEPTDQTPAGKASNLLAGTAQQIEDILKRYRDAGMTMPLLWPPFRDVPTSKTMDDLRRLTEEIMPKVNAG